MPAANEQYSYALNLIDNITFPAKQARGSFKSFEDILKGLDGKSATPKVGIDGKAAKEQSENIKKEISDLVKSIASLVKSIHLAFNIQVKPKVDDKGAKEEAIAAGTKSARYLVASFLFGVQKMGVNAQSVASRSFSALPSIAQNAFKSLHIKLTFASDFLKEMHRISFAPISQALAPVLSAASSALRKTGSIALSVSKSIASSFSKMGSSLSGAFRMPLSSVYYLMEIGKALFNQLKNIDLSFLTKGLDLKPITSIIDTFKKFTSTTSPELTKLRSGLQAIINTFGMFLKPINDVKVMKSAFSSITTVLESVYNGFLIIAAFSVRFFGTIFKEAKRGFAPLNTGVDILGDLRKGFDKMKPVAVFLGSVLRVAIQGVQVVIAGLWRMVQSASASFSRWVEPISKVSSEIMELINPTGEADDLIKSIISTFETFGSVLGTIVGGAISGALQAIKLLIQGIQGLQSAFAALSGTRAKVSVDKVNTEKTKKAVDQAPVPKTTLPPKTTNTVAQAQKAQVETQKQLDASKKSVDEGNKLQAKGNTQLNEIATILKSIQAELAKQGAGLGAAKAGGF